MPCCAFRRAGCRDLTGIPAWLDVPDVSFSCILRMTWGNLARLLGSSKDKHLYYWTASTTSCFLAPYYITPSTKSSASASQIYTMGLFSNFSGPQELHPVNPPLGIYSNFTAKQPTMLTLREHAFSFSGVCPSLTCVIVVHRYYRKN